MKSEPDHSDALATSRSDAEVPPAEVNSIDKQLTELRSQISDLGYEIDLFKAGVAGLMGGGIFLLLLGAGAGYDLLTGKEGVWSPLGGTHDRLLLIAWGLGIAGAVLIIRGVIQQRRRDREREARLAELERQYSRLLDRKESFPQGRA